MTSWGGRLRATEHYGSLQLGRRKIILDVVAPQILIRTDQIQAPVFFIRGRKGEKEFIRASVW
jgi:hypothetical protein